MRFAFHLLSLGVLATGVLAQDPSYDDLLRTIDELRHEVQRTNEFNNQANHRIGELERDIEWFKNDRIPTIEREFHAQLEQKQGVVDQCNNEKNSLVSTVDQCNAEKNSLAQTITVKEEGIREVQAGLETCNTEKGGLAQSLAAKEEEINQHVNTCQNEKSLLQQDSQRDLGVCEEQKSTCNAQVASVEQNRSAVQAEKEKLEQDLRQLNDEHIPTLKKEHEETMAKCQSDAGAKETEHKEKYSALEKSMKKQVNSLEDKLSGLESMSDKQKSELKKNKKQLEEANSKFFDTRQELFKERDSLRKLQSEVDTTLVFVNFPLLKERVTTFYDTYLKEYLGPIISEIQKFWKKTAFPALKGFYNDTLLPGWENMKPIMNQIYKDMIKPVIDLLEEKDILPTIRNLWNTYVHKTVLLPFHKEFTRMIREASKMAANYMQMNNFSPTFINTAQYIKKHPKETAILYYKIFGLWFGIILFKLIFFSGGSQDYEQPPQQQMNGTSSGGKKKKKNKNKNPQSPAQLYEMETKKRQ